MELSSLSRLILTVGHSTRSIEEFMELLGEHGVRRAVDVRTVPRSLRNPQFNRDRLPQSLGRMSIEYEHLPELGGLRHSRKDSPNTAWRNLSFRGFADYMQTPEFEAGLQKLLALAGREPTAIMCAEAVPWRCHRSLIADALLARGVPVAHILGHRTAQPHKITPFAKVAGAGIVYPAENVTE